MIGHQQVREQLEAELPNVVLLMGPVSVGKRTLCEHLVDHYGVHDADVLRFESFNVEGARTVRQFFQRRSLSGRKIIIVRLDGASQEALNSLLKVAEQPPAFAHLLFIASGLPLLTIQSRAQYRAYLPYLTEAEVAEVLMEQGFDAARARAMAKHAGGQVASALASIDLEVTKAPVLSVLKAIADQNEVLLQKAIEKFEASHLALFRTWAVEARTGCWKMFMPQEDFGVHKDRKRVDLLLRKLAWDARPKVVVRAAVLPMMTS
jgi:DNA polymerase III, delta subunit